MISPEGRRNDDPMMHCLDEDGCKNNDFQAKMKLF
jgi:hypothetical protein